ncbi:hypothetical protein [Sanguibacter sp. HDW7]|uniref:hypothetical protein n=1 Tax=Sanguibacter sp. HDW7 TaxID=2714931 RepID=UPI00197F75B8|nr:hypothetical protein [Sanguibacter sp. HDW7]
MTLSLAALAALLPAQTLTPSPSPSDVLRPGLDPYDVSPGLIGFLAIFAVAAVCVLGWMSLNRKVRRMRFAERAEAAEQEGARSPETVEGSAADGAVADGTATDGPAAGDSSVGSAAGDPSADGDAGEPDAPRG